MACVTVSRSVWPVSPSVGQCGRWRSDVGQQAGTTGVLEVRGVWMPGVDLIAPLPAEAQSPSTIFCMAALHSPCRRPTLPPSAASFRFLSSRFSSLVQHPRRPRHRSHAAHAASTPPPAIVHSDSTLPIAALPSNR